MVMKSASSRPLQGDRKGHMATKKKPVKTGKDQRQETSRLWLMYPPKLIQRPLIWEISHKFPVITNVRQASVTDKIGIVCLELDGKRGEIKAAIKWMERIGVKVEPVEINVIES